MKSDYNVECFIVDIIICVDVYKRQMQCFQLSWQLPTPTTLIHKCDLLHSTCILLEFVQLKLINSSCIIVRNTRHISCFQKVIFLVLRPIILFRFLYFRNNIEHFMLLTKVWHVLYLPGCCQNYFRTCVYLWITLLYIIPNVHTTTRFFFINDS